MADNDKNTENTEETQEEKAIRLGEQEYTPEELEQYVNKAKAVSEFEEKQGQEWDEVTKSWGKRGEVIGAFKKATGYDTPDEYLEAQQQKEQESLQQKAKQSGDLSPEENEKLVKQELAKYFDQMGVVTQDRFDQLYKQRREGEKLLSRTKRTIKKNVKNGYPEVSEEELLKYMADPQNPGDPEKAYKLMFEDDIAKINEDKQKSMKKKGVTTQATSTAGETKEPKQKKITDENLDSVLSEHLSRGT